uniref:Uncharacterized protein n=1 Tax=Photinus pyralis TaxID=7054 RepID=A0A1Y1LRH2_PHOPY
MLGLDKVPTPGNNHEEIHPKPKVEPQRQPKFKLGPSIILTIHKRVRINKLSLQPATPVPHRFPYQSDSSHTHEEPEEDAKDNWQILKIVSFNFDIGEEADKGTGSDKACPVPLPSSTDGVETFCGAEIQCAMLG